MKEKMINTLTARVKKGYVAAMMTAMMMGPVFSTTSMITYAASPSIIYQAHVAGIGWKGDVSNGTSAGTTGQSRAIECVTFEVQNTGYSGGIRYRVHMAGKGWSDWVYDDRPCGTTGEGRQTEAIELQLYGEVANHYKLEYRTHCQNVGWTKWISSGVSGTTGQGLRMEDVQARLVKKNSSTGTATKVSSSVNFANLKNTYPNNSKWNSSFMNKAWQCHGFACTLGYSLSGKDPYTWKKAYNLNSLKPGDILRFNRPHSIMVTAVNGSEITYVDCNWVGKNTVKWDQKIQKNKMTGKWGSLNYVMQYPN